MGSDKLTYLLGRTTVVKTTILEALFLLTSPTNAELPLRINAFRDFNIVDENSLRLIFNRLDVNSNIKISGELDKPKEKRNLIIRPNTKTVTTLPKTTIHKETLDIKDSYSGPSYAIDGLILEYSLMKGRNRKPKKVTTKIVMKGPGIEVKIPRNYKEILRGVLLNPLTISSDIAKRFNNIQIRKQTDRIIKILRQIEGTHKCYG